jgi:hypothetical protein
MNQIHLVAPEVFVVAEAGSRIAKLSAPIPLSSNRNCTSRVCNWCTIGVPTVISGDYSYRNGNHLTCLCVCGSHDKLVVTAFAEASRAAAPPQHQYYLLDK